jgi:hypothetical protein
MPASPDDQAFDTGRAALISLMATYEKIGVFPETADLRIKIAGQIGDRAVS